MKVDVGDKNTDLLEYALILVLVAIVIVSILSLLGPQVENIFMSITVGGPGH